jgi:trafficking protein particle complex subunit 11
LTFTFTPLHSFANELAMNSYPAELLVQLAPVMFVAGLTPRTSQTTQSPLTPTEPTPPPTEAGQPNEQLQTAGNTSRRRDTVDQFDSLARRLRDVLTTQRKPAIWEPEVSRKSKSFHVVFVDEVCSFSSKLCALHIVDMMICVKIVQFPPRKVPVPRSTADTASSQSPRSPLSPSHPSSPLFPDGLIAPIWIRKHTTLVPSVFVLFLRLFENPIPLSTPRSPLEPQHPERQRELEEREKEDRKHDEKLSQKIADRKKSTNERNMKLTVVLLASRHMLDDPALDARLTFIRRSSGLDSRAALFVLSPVSQAELSEFVKRYVVDSLQNTPKLTDLRKYTTGSL